MAIVLVVAPHPDDETLGCGGTLLKHRSQGDEIYWAIVTSIHEGQEFPEEICRRRLQEIEAVQLRYGFKKRYELGFPATELDTQPKSKLIRVMSSIFLDINPNILYIPNRNDIHSDHEVSFDIVAACTKSFRYPSVKSVRVYEVPSETEFGIRPDDRGFRPNYFIDITAFLEEKLNIMRIYKSEVQISPFPRSLDVLRSLALVRGSVIGCLAAEAFMSLREIA